MTRKNHCMSPPSCENCGRDKSPTYICDRCLDKLNTINQNTRAQLAACAAGPWRYDVENLEDDVYYLCAYPTGFQALSGLVIKLDSRPFKGAFAVLNAPEGGPLG